MNATEVTLLDCSPASCDRPDVLRFTLDAAAFRRAVASATYKDGKAPSKGSFLLLATLPDGTVEQFKAHYGGHVLSPRNARGSWVFEGPASNDFRGFLNDFHQSVVIPARSRRNAQQSAPAPAH